MISVFLPLFGKGIHSLCLLRCIKHCAVGHFYSVQAKFTPSTMEILISLQFSIESIPVQCPYKFSFLHNLCLFWLICPFHCVHMHPHPSSILLSSLKSPCNLIVGLSVQMLHSTIYRQRAKMKMCNSNKMINAKCLARFCGAHLV